MKFILFPEEIDASSPIGGKARALAELSQAELQVPPWFVVLPDAFQASLTPSRTPCLNPPERPTRFVAL